MIKTTLRQIIPTKGWLSVLTHYTFSVEGSVITHITQPLKLIASERMAVFISINLLISISDYRERTPEIQTHVCVWGGLWRLQNGHFSRLG